MELLLAKGTDWIFMEWMNGGLDVLLSASRRLAVQRAELEQQQRRVVELEQTIAAQAELVRQHEATLASIQAGGWWRLRKRLLPMLRVYWWLRRHLHP